MVMPLYDDNPFRLPHRPVVTWSLILINLVVFLIEVSTVEGPNEMIHDFGLVPAALMGDGVVEGALTPVFTLVTYMFLHADVGHFFGNMIFLWVFGDNLEEALGRVRFIIFYLVSGIVGAFAFVATDPHSHTPLIGASGAIAGVVVGYVMLRPCAKITVLFWLIPLRISAYWVVGAFAVLQFIHLGSSSPSEVAYWCHVGGMAAGAVLFLVLRPPGVKLFECIRAPFLRVEPAPDAPGGARGGWDPR